MPTNYLKGYTLDGSTLTEYIVDETDVGGGNFLAAGSFLTVDAAGGAQYTTITAALAAATTGDEILVYPGTYAENITINDSVRVKGFGFAQNVIIAGADTTGTRVTINGTGTLREITVVGPSSGANPAIDCTGLSVAELAVLFGVVVIGGGGTGSGIKGAGSGLLVGLDGVYHNGGTFGGSFIEVTAGIGLFHTLIANIGVSSELVKVTGGIASIQSVLTQDSTLYSTDDLLCIGGGELRVQSMLVPRDTPATNGLHVTADGVKISCNSAALLGSAYDVLVDPLLQGTGTEFFTDGCSFRYERLSFPALFPQNAAIESVFLDSGVENDPSYRIVGAELAVGSPEVPTESAFGEGDSTVLGMEVWTHDGAANWVDESADASSSAGSTFTLFQALTAGNACYFINTYRTFPGIKMSGIGTAWDLAGGSVVWEYWNGSAWTAVSVLACDADDPYEQFAQDIFGRTGDTQLRLGDTTGWATNDPGAGTTGYCLRCRIATGPITTAAVIERTKLGTNRAEINRDGTLEFFGLAEVERTFYRANPGTMSAPSGGANAPGTINVAVSANIDYQLPGGYAAANDERLGDIFAVPYELNTAKPLTCTLGWKPSSTNTGTVDWEIYVVGLRSGDVLGALTEVSDAVSPTAPGVADEYVETTLSVTLPDVVPGDSYALAVWRRGSADTFTGVAELVSVRIDGTFWR